MLITACIFTVVPDHTFYKTVITSCFLNVKHTLKKLWLKRFLCQYCNFPLPGSDDHSPLLSRYVCFPYIDNNTLKINTLKIVPKNVKFCKKWDFLGLFDTPNITVPSP